MAAMARYSTEQSGAAASTRRPARRILVVDDERVSRFTTQSALEQLGFEVVTLDDGRGAAEAEATGQFDAIIMDCQMPFMDGFEATAAIRRHQRASHGRRTPIIGLSARAMRGDDQVALSKGMDVYVTKPASIRKLRAALEQVQVGASRADRPTTRPCATSS